MAYLSELASYGHAVIAIDHPGEAPYLPLPYTNGTGGIYGYPDFTGFPPTNEITFQVLDYRVTDILALMSDPFLPALVRQYAGPFNLTHLGIFGHSIGGAAAAAVMASNTTAASKFKVGCNLDGTILQVVDRVTFDYNSTPPPDLQRPFLQVAAEDHFQGNASGGNSDMADGTWKYFNDAQSGWLRDVQVNGTTHLDFSDIVLWIDLLEQREVLNRTWVGVADGVRVTGLVNALLREFFASVEGKGLEGVDSWMERAPELFLLDGHDA